MALALSSRLIENHGTFRRLFWRSYSIEFGHADLPRVAELCREAYPDYEVTWKEGGY